MELILVRHAHAGPHTADDKGRHLSERGIEEALLLGEWMHLKQFPVGFWLISDAIRTRETAELLGKPFSEFELSEFWYVSSGPDYVTEIAKRTEPILYLVAHNPSISYLASFLTGDMIQMETAGCVSLHFPGLSSWSEISKGSATITHQL
jgi:phosphohistidine phosphatase